MLKVNMFAGLLLLLVGSLDCITTSIGILYFGAVECNPFMAGIVHTDLAAFTLLKLTTTVIVALIFYVAQKMILTSYDQSSRAFKIGRGFIKTAYLGVIGITLVVVFNNVLVIAGAI